VPVDGLCLLNGVNIFERDNYNLFRDSIGYVPQDDIIHKELSVYNALYYSACLRLPSDTPKIELEGYVEDVFGTLKVGCPKTNLISQLSGGQRKRISIGVELISLPRLLFLDEPTSGLDPGTELRMMELFEDLAHQQGKTIILITHATSNIVKCDKVAFLTKGKDKDTEKIIGGQLAFYGTPKEAISYFNVKEFAEIYEKLEDLKAFSNPRHWKDEFKKSSLYQKNVTQLLQGTILQQQGGGLQQQGQQGGQASNLKKKKKQAPGCSTKKISAIKQLKILLVRYWNIICNDFFVIRNKTLNIKELQIPLPIATGVLVPIILAMLIILVFLGKNFNKEFHYPLSPTVIEYPPVKDSLQIYKVNYCKDSKFVGM
jgi:ABC-type multidrug transport system ATPase subunit